jgi:hypothetical protein
MVVAWFLDKFKNHAINGAYSSEMRQFLGSKSHFKHQRVEDMPSWSVLVAVGVGSCTFFAY